MSRARVSVTALLVVVAFASLGIPSTQQVFVVSPETDLQSVLDAAPPHSIIELTSGLHRGPVVVDRDLSLKGPRDAVIAAPLEADAALTVDEARLSVEGITVQGGWTGIDLLSATGTTVRDVAVRGADAQGIRVYRRSATLERVEVSGLSDPHAQGIEVLSAPDVIVRDSIVRGGKVGIVAHLSTVRFERNLVTGTTETAIMIREMGSGTATGNTIRGASGAGLYCGDMSRCEFAGNRVGLVTAASNTRSSAGWGLVVHYRSTASTTGDVLRGTAGAAVVLADSRLVPSSPLDVGSGLSGIMAGGWALVLALGALTICFALARFVVPPGGWRSPDLERLAPIAVAILFVGLAVQSFHMFEHWLQLYRVHFEGVPSRGGLVGSVAEVEWVHLVYNGAVLGGLAALVALRRRGWRPPGRIALGDRLLVAGVAIQGYHLVEHVLKVSQHLATGAKVNPGFLGRHADLVLVHFGINGAVYLAFLGLSLAYLLTGSRSRRGFRRRSPVTA